MKILQALLKTFGFILLIPISCVMVVVLGYIGFAVDLSHSGSGSGFATYMFVLPLGFIAGAGWLVSAFLKRRSTQEVKRQALALRRRVYREQELGTTDYEIIVNTLKRDGGMSVELMALRTGIDHDVIITYLKALLADGLIRQDIRKSPPEFKVVSPDN